LIACIAVIEPCRLLQEQIAFWVGYKRDPLFYNKDKSTDMPANIFSLPGKSNCDLFGSFCRIIGGMVLSTKPKDAVLFSDGDSYLLQIFRMSQMVQINCRCGCMLDVHALTWLHSL
jgi:hypothetical protein